jgi:hypothetical protein
MSGPGGCEASLKRKGELVNSLSYAIRSAGVGSGKNNWPAAGFVDTQFGCFMKREVENAKTQVQ